MYETTYLGDLHAKVPNHGARPGSHMTQWFEQTMPNVFPMDCTNHDV